MIAAETIFHRKEVVAAVGGQLTRQSRRSSSYLGVSTDTRDLLDGYLFVALSGQNFDAHNFLDKAVDGGASALLVSKSGLEKIGGLKSISEDVDVIVVPDSLKALGDLAHYHKKRVGVPVIAITGSNGKTTTKEMVASLLRQKHSIWVTQGNYNNLVGLPFTLLGLRAHHQWCIAEMGMNARGEIDRMVQIAEPQIRLVTNIGPAHIGELGSMEEISRAKGELFGRVNLNPDGLAIVNSDDLRVMALENLKDWKQQRTFGSMSADVQVVHVESGIDSLTVDLKIDKRELQIKLPMQGQHNALNAVGAIAAATAVTSLTDEEIGEGFAQLPKAKGRLMVRKVGHYTVVDDSYNANLVSALSAIKTATSVAKGSRLVAAFGEMLELGVFSEDAHREVGRALTQAGAAIVATFGPGARPVLDGYGLGEAKHESDNFEALMGWFTANVQPGDVILLKGSRGSRMERVIEYLEGAN